MADAEREALMALDPGSDEAKANGCTCDPKAQVPNWHVIDPKCPIHSGAEYILWATSRPRRRKSKKE